jgi:hypothetical protein
MIKPEHHSLFSSLFSFQNRLQQKEAEQFIVSPSYLYRHDRSRLVSYRFNQNMPFSQVMRYDYVPLSKTGMQKLERIQDTCYVETDHERLALEPISIPFQEQFIQIMDWEKEQFSWQVTLPGKEWALRILPLMQKAYQSKKEEEEVIHIFGEGESIIFSSGNQKCVLPAFVKGTSFASSIYFWIWQDLLLRVKEEVTLLFYPPYFFRIDYGKNIGTILFFKRNIEKKENLIIG